MYQHQTRNSLVSPISTCPLLSIYLLLHLRLFDIYFAPWGFEPRTLSFWEVRPFRPVCISLTSSTLFWRAFGHILFDISTSSIGHCHRDVFIVWTLLSRSGTKVEPFKTAPLNQNSNSRNEPAGGFFITLKAAPSIPRGWWEEVVLFASRCLLSQQAQPVLFISPTLTVQK